MQSRSLGMFIVIFMEDIMDIWCKLVVGTELVECSRYNTVKEVQDAFPRARKGNT